MWQPQPGVRLFECLHGRDRFLCDLRDDVPHGVEAQFFLNGEISRAGRFDTRALVIAWAEQEKLAIEKGVA